MTASYLVLVSPMRASYRDRRADAAATEGMPAKRKTEDQVRSPCVRKSELPPSTFARWIALPASLLDLIAVARTETRAERETCSHEKNMGDHQVKATLPLMMCVGRLRHGLAPLTSWPHGGS